MNIFTKRYIVNLPLIYRFSWIFIIVTIHVIAIPHYSFAQPQIKFQHFGRDEGLTNIAVRGIVQDSLGFIWHGSSGGLHKYDGYHFTTYRYDPKDTTSISSDLILDIILDDDSNFWIATAGSGINFFDRESEKFRRFVHNDQDNNSLVGNLVRTLYLDRQGYIWIGTKGSGLDRLNPRTLEFNHYPFNTNQGNSMQGSDVWAICQDQEGFIWVGTNLGLNRLDPSTGKFTFYSPQSEKAFHMDGDSRIRAIYQDGEGFIWIGTFSDLKRFDPNANTFKIYQSNVDDPFSPDGAVWRILETRDGKFWLGTFNGLSLLDRETGTFIRYQNNPLDPNTISPGRILFLFEDRQGSLWFGGDNGLNYFHPLSARFKYLQPDPFDTRTLGSNWINSFSEYGKGKTLITTASGLFSLHPEEDRVEPILLFAHDPYNLSNLIITEIAEDGKGTLWIGTWDNGLFSFKPESQTFEHFTYDPDDPVSLSQSNINCILITENGIMWIGTHGGLNRFDTSNGIFHRFLHTEEDPNSISHNLIFDILEDSDGNLWIATSGGLNRFDRQKQEFIRYYHNPQDPNSLPGNSINSIMEDRSGTLWIATSNGLARMEDKEKAIFTAYTFKDGLPTQGVLGLTEDNQGNLWLSTILGISKLDPVTGIFTNLTTEDGLIANEVLCIFSSKQNDKIYLGTKKGISFFQPDDIKPNSFIPPVVITRYKKFRIQKDEITPVIDENIALKSAIRTSHKDILSFEFSALNYHNPSNNQYAYKLQGVSDNWIQLGHERSVTFANLRPKEYTLRVRGSNNDGIWNQEGAPLKIIVTPPWHKSDLVRLLYLILVIAGLYALYRFQLKRQLEQAEFERVLELDRVKDKLYSNITHEFRTPLTVIEGMSDLILNQPRKKQVESIQSIKRNTKNVLHLINQMLDLRKLESGKMPLHVIQADIVQYLRYLGDSFRPLAESKGIRLHFLANVDILIMDFDPDTIFQIVSNLISNGIKFTNEGDIYLQVSEISKMDVKALEIRVKDNGLGISEEQLPYIFDRFYQVDHDLHGKPEGTGIGLALTREMVKVLRGDISVNSSTGKGTEFVIVLPISNAARIFEPSDLQVDIDTKFSVAIPTEASVADTADFSHIAGEHHYLVLIIEDNLDMIAYLVACLEEHYRLIIAHDGKDGLKEAMEHIPDVIISDVMMPGMDGFEVCTALKNDERTSHIPFILLTAMADIKSRIEGLERGADAYLAKPFNRELLLVRIRNLIELRKRLHKRYSAGKPPTRSSKKFEMEDQFLRKLKGIIEENMGNANFGLVQVYQAMGLSRSQLFRKIKALTGKSTSIFIRTVRLNKAKDLLKNSDLNVSEVAYEVGFNDLSYFSRTFTEEFGINPSELCN